MTNVTIRLSLEEPCLFAFDVYICKYCSARPRSTYEAADCAPRTVAANRTQRNVAADRTQHTVVTDLSMHEATRTVVNC